MTDYLRDPFGTPPTDVATTKRQLTRESLKRMNDLVGSDVTYTEPGEVLEDADGIPNAVGPTTTTQAFFGGIAVARHEVDALGITADELARDFPNITIIDAPTTKEH